MFKIWNLQSKEVNYTSFKQETAKEQLQLQLESPLKWLKKVLLTKERAIQLVDPYQLYQLLLPSFDIAAKKQAVKLATGLAASPGAAVGKIVFNTDEAAERGEAGEKVILVRIETCPDDIHGMIAAQGVLTLRGGMTSHAAVVAKVWVNHALQAAKT